MAAESEIKLVVNTAADTAGLDAATKSTKELEAATKQATAAVNPWTTAAHMATKATKEAVDTTGYYIDSLGRLHAAGGQFVSTKTAEMAAIRDHLKATQQATAATQQHGAAVNQVRGATERNTRTMSTGSQAMIAWGRTAQDAGSQLNNGVLAVINATANNVDQLFPKLPMLGGALALVAVAFQVAGTQFDIFGTQAAEARKNQDELAESAAKAAKEAHNQAAEAALATAAERARVDSLNALTEAYNKQTEAIKRNAAEQVRAAAVAARLAGEEAKGEALDIDAQVATGEMTPRQGAQAKEEIRRRAAEKDRRRNEMDSSAAFNSEQQRAAAAEAQAQKIGGRISALGGKSEGLLSSEERKALEKDIESKKAELDKVKLERDQLVSPIVESGRKAGGLIGAAANAYSALSDPENRVIRQDLERREKLLKEQMERKEAALAQDKEAASRIGPGASKDTVQSEMDELEKERKKQKEVAEEARAKAAEIARAEADAKRITAAEEANARKAAEVADFRAAGAERNAYDQELEREAGEFRGRQTRARGAVDKGTDAIAAKARGAGASEQWAAQLEEAGNQYAAGNDEMLKTVQTMVSQLAGSTKLTAAALTAIRRENEAMQAAIAELKDGR